MVPPPAQDARLALVSILNPRRRIHMTVHPHVARSLAAPVVGASLILAFWCMCAGLAAQGQPAGGAARFPGRLEEDVATHLKLTADERKAVFAGTPIVKALDADPAVEMALSGVVWIDVPAALYVRAMNDIERFETGGGIRISKRISEPPQLVDFKQMEIPDEDAADLARCNVGDCEIKLGQGALDRLRKEVDWSKPGAADAAEAIVRELAFSYVTAYREGGNSRLAVYRDASKPTFVANEFASMVERMPELTQDVPEMKRYLLEYPHLKIPGVTSFFYWQEMQFGLKPTIRINHLIMQQAAGGIAVASKQIYASHYFWTGLEVRVLVPDPSRGRGFWFVSINRSRSDGLSGFTGRLIRGRVRSEAQTGLADGLAWVKSTLEGWAKTGK